MTDFKEIQMVIDLDRERGIPPRENRTPNQHKVTIRKTAVVNLAAVRGYLDGSTSFNNTVLEAISKISTHTTINQY